MTVERRYNERFPVDFGVIFRYRDHGLFRSRACDLSLEGMQLAPWAFQPSKGTLVELRFSLQGRSWNIPAVVTHSAPRRVGVMFREAQPTLYQMIKKIGSPLSFWNAPKQFSA